MPSSTITLTASEMSICRRVLPFWRLVIAAYSLGPAITAQQGKLYKSINSHTKVGHASIVCREKIRDIQTTTFTGVFAYRKGPLKGLGGYGHFEFERRVGGIILKMSRLRVG